MYKVGTSHISRRGFTIVELLIVIVVIGILAALVIVAYNGIQSRADRNATLHALNQTYKAVETYKLAHSTHPSSLAQAGVGQQSTNTPINMIIGSGVTQAIPTLSGYPDVTIYAVFDIINSSGN